jgi:Type IV secretion-system coupling protein DNA-binding domain
MGGLCRPRHPGFGALDAGPTSSSSPPAPFGLRGVWVVAAREKRATRHMRCSGVNRGVRLTGSTGFLFLVNSHSTPRSLARDRHGERNGIDQERGSREPRRGGVPTLSESRERRVWLFLDEFPQLPPIKQFPTFLELGRSKGIAVVIGAQEDAHQCQRGSGGHQPADWRPGDRAAHPKRHPLRRTCQRHGKRPAHDPPGDNRVRICISPRTDRARRARALHRPGRRDLRAGTSLHQSADLPRAHHPGRLDPDTASARFNNRSHVQSRWAVWDPIIIIRRCNGTVAGERFLECSHDCRCRVAASQLATM